MLSLKNFNIKVDEFVVNLDITETGNTAVFWWPSNPSPANPISDAVVTNQNDNYTSDATVTVTMTDLSGKTATQTLTLNKIPEPETKLNYITRNSDGYITFVFNKDVSDKNLSILDQNNTNFEMDISNNEVTINTKILNDLAQLIYTDNNITYTYLGSSFYILPKTINVDSNITVTPGWNMLTLPFGRTAQASEILERPEVVKIWAYDGEWKDDSNIGTLHSGTGYWFKVNLGVNTLGEIVTYFDKATYTQQMGIDVNENIANYLGHEQEASYNNIYKSLPDNAWRMMGTPSGAQAGDILYMGEDEGYKNIIYYYNPSSRQWNDTNEIPVNGALWIKKIK
jgi:hypothetical protein